LGSFAFWNDAPIRVHAPTLIGGRASGFVAGMDSVWVGVGGGGGGGVGATSGVGAGGGGGGVPSVGGSANAGEAHKAAPNNSPAASFEDRVPTLPSLMFVQSRDR
jgi:hypothetical protein